MSERDAEHGRTMRPIPALFQQVAKGWRNGPWFRAVSGTTILALPRLARGDTRSQVAVSALEKPIKMGYSDQMVTVLRAHGLRVAIFTNDHRPAHVHVFGDGEAKINLAGPEGTRSWSGADNMSHVAIRRAMRLVAPA